MSTSPVGTAERSSSEIIGVNGDAVAEIMRLDLSSSQLKIYSLIGIDEIQVANTLASENGNEFAIST